MDLKTSDEWQKLKPQPVVLDPDGWDRTNYQYSWFEELITEDEYDKRLSQSTIIMTNKKYLNDLLTHYEND